MSATRHAPATHGPGLQITPGPFDRDEHIALHSDRGIIGYYSRRAALRLMHTVIDAIKEADRNRENQRARRRALP
jgi:hypothetical protein